LKTAYAFGDTAIGTLLGLGAASTSGGQEDDRSAGGGRPSRSIREGEPGSANLRDGNALNNLASPCRRVDETSFDVSDCDDVQAGMQLHVGLPVNSSVRGGPTAQTGLGKPQVAKPNSPRKPRTKQQKKWKDYVRSNNASAKLQLLDADDSTFCI
jgi:hypothetical protein